MTRAMACCHNGAGFAITHC